MTNPYTPNNRPPYHWISVEDELPEQKTTVLAIWRNGKQKRLLRSYIGPRYNQWWPIDDADRINLNLWHVIHWQYLPALPE